MQTEADVVSSKAKFYQYAQEGKKHKLKALLKADKTIDINELDSSGETALYKAVRHERKEVVEFLLEHSADPNKRNFDGQTAVHICAYTCNIKIMCLLIKYGGDLRLHDSNNRNPKKYATDQPNAILRRRMLGLIEDVRKLAFINLNQEKPSEDRYNLNIQARTINDTVNPYVAGFGILFKTGNEVGVTTILPNIQESELTDDPCLKWNNGAFMVYDRMKWKQTHTVTVKKLTSEALKSGQIDLIINELKFYRRIAHSPKILSLMGFCQCDNADNMFLVFERISVGSLFNSLHEMRSSSNAPNNMKRRVKSVFEIAMNVLDALMFLHEHNIIHNYVNSHSIFLTDTHTAKLGNLEYAVQKLTDPANRDFYGDSRITFNKYLNCAYNWMAPEVIEGEYPSEMSDMYSFCVVIWEIFNLKVPYHNKCAEEIKCIVTIDDVDNNMKKIVNNVIESVSFPFSRIVADGLAINPLRRMKFPEVRGQVEHHYESLLVQASSRRPSRHRANSSASRQGSSGNAAAANGSSNMIRFHSRERRAADNQPMVGSASLNREGHTNCRHRHHSYSEGIASINEDLYSVGGNTLNSQEQLDNFSQMSNQYVECNSYTAEIHMRKRNNSGNTHASPSQPQHTHHQRDTSMSRKKPVNGAPAVAKQPSNKSPKRTRSSSRSRRNVDGPLPNSPKHHFDNNMNATLSHGAAHQVLNSTPNSQPPPAAPPLPQQSPPSSSGGQHVPNITTPQQKNTNSHQHTSATHCKHQEDLYQRLPGPPPNDTLLTSPPPPPPPPPNTQHRPAMTSSPRDIYQLNIQSASVNLMQREKQANANSIQFSRSIDSRVQRPNPTSPQQQQQQPVPIDLASSEAVLAELYNNYYNIDENSKKSKGDVIDLLESCVATYGEAAYLNQVLESLKTKSTKDALCHAFENIVEKRQREKQYISNSLEAKNNPAEIMKERIGYFNSFNANNKEESQNEEENNNNEERANFNSKFDNVSNNMAKDTPLDKRRYLSKTFANGGTSINNEQVNNIQGNLNFSNASQEDNTIERNTNIRSKVGDSGDFVDHKFTYATEQKNRPQMEKMVFSNQYPNNENININNNTNPSSTFQNIRTTIQRNKMHRQQQQQDENNNNNIGSGSESVVFPPPVGSLIQRSSSYNSNYSLRHSISSANNNNSNNRPSEHRSRKPLVPVAPSPSSSANSEQRQQRNQAPVGYSSLQSNASSVIQRRSSVDSSHANNSNNNNANKKIQENIQTSVQGLVRDFESKSRVLGADGSGGSKSNSQLNLFTRTNSVDRMKTSITSSNAQEKSTTASLRQQQVDNATRLFHACPPPAPPPPPPPPPASTLTNLSTITEKSGELLNSSSNSRSKNGSLTRPVRNTTNLIQQHESPHLNLDSTGDNLTLTSKVFNSPSTNNRANGTNSSGKTNKCTNKPLIMAQEMFETQLKHHEAVNSNHRHSTLITKDNNNNNNTSSEHTPPQQMLSSKHSPYSSTNNAVTPTARIIAMSESKKTPLNGNGHQLKYTGADFNNNINNNNMVVEDEIYNDTESKYHARNFSQNDFLADEPNSLEMENFSEDLITHDFDNLPTQSQAAPRSPNKEARFVNYLIDQNQYNDVPEREGIDVLIQKHDVIQDIKGINKNSSNNTSAISTTNNKPSKSINSKIQQLQSPFQNHSQMIQAQSQSQCQYQNNVLGCIKNNVINSPRDQPANNSNNHRSSSNKSVSRISNHPLPDWDKHVNKNTTHNRF